MASSLLLQPAFSATRKVRPASAPLRGPFNPLHSPLFLPLLPSSSRQRSSSFISRAKGKIDGQDVSGSQKSGTASVPLADGEEEVEEDLPWIQEKAMDLVEFTGTVTQALPGPRVGQSKLPWILAVPLAYIGLSFVIAFVKTVKKFTSPRAQKKRLVNKNATLLKSIDELFAQGSNQLQFSALKGLMQKTDFSMEDILRKYIRYSLNEKPFNPELVVNLIALRKASMLQDSQVADVLNELSRRIVKEKGPVVMDISGFTEKGFKRKLAVQALFAKVLYLSELPDICSKDGSLMIKEIFGVTDADAETLRIQTLSESGDVDLLEKMVESDSQEKDSPGTKSTSS